MPKIKTTAVEKYGNSPQTVAFDTANTALEGMGTPYILIVPASNTTLIKLSCDGSNYGTLDQLYWGIRTVFGDVDKLILDLLNGPVNPEPESKDE